MERVVLPEAVKRAELQAAATLGRVGRPDRREALQVVAAAQAHLVTTAEAQGPLPRWIAAPKPDTAELAA